MFEDFNEVVCLGKGGSYSEIAKDKLFCAYDLFLYQLSLTSIKECIEYVVVHELTHLLERGHNVHFYGILDQVYPNWKACRERLKKE